MFILFFLLTLLVAILFDVPIWIGALFVAFGYCIIQIMKNKYFKPATIYLFSLLALMVEEIARHNNIPIFYTILLGVCCWFCFMIIIGYFWRKQNLNKVIEEINKIEQ